MVVSQRRKLPIQNRDASQDGSLAESDEVLPAKPTKNDVRDTTSLDVVSDLRHFGYKIPGMSTWLVFVILVIGAVLIPNAALVVLQLIGLYLMLRIALVVIFYPVSLIRSRRWEARARLAAQNGTSLAGAASSVHHVVIIPNYKEPIAILVRTFHALAAQENAQQQLTVVLAMEESDRRGGQGPPVAGSIRRSVRPFPGHLPPCRPAQRGGRQGVKRELGCAPGQGGTGGSAGAADKEHDPHLV